MNENFLIAEVPNLYEKLFIGTLIYAAIIFTTQDNFSEQKKAFNHSHRMRSWHSFWFFQDPKKLWCAPFVVYLTNSNFGGTLDEGSDRELFIHRKAMVLYVQLPTNCGLDSFITVKKNFTILTAYFTVDWQLHIWYHNLPVYKEFPGSESTCV